MGKYSKIVNHSRAGAARTVLIVMLRVTRYLLRVLLRRPLINILLLLWVLYLIASLIGSVNQPQGVLYQTPTVFESR